MSVLQVNGVGYTYCNKFQTVEALKDVNCSFDRGKFYAIAGPSGSGKTTFLSLLAGLDLPSKGTILVDGEDMATLNRDAYRREVASVVFQSFNLFPLLTAFENVCYPMELRGVEKKNVKKLAHEYIASVSLPQKIENQLPLMMSGGEQQRVAIARALAAGGKILLADEPTGNLDTANGDIIISLLKNLAHEHSYAVIVITHNMDVAESADHTCQMRDGFLTVCD